MLTTNFTNWIVSFKVEYKMLSVRMLTSLSMCVHMKGIANYKTLTIINDLPINL